MDFSIKNPSTLTVVFQPHELPLTFRIYNSRGQLYFFRYVDMPEIRVNIKHPDSYTTNGPKVQSIEPIIIRPLFVILPPHERKGLEKPVEIKYHPELTKEKGTPARHYTHKGLIEIGDFFNSLPPAIRYFILLHEYAHFFYETEHYCDLWAAKKFIAEGYNNSTAYYALTEVLRDTDENTKRILSLEKNLNKR